jgi:hypothetical protein
MKTKIEEKDYKIYRITHWNDIQKKEHEISPPILGAYFPKEMAQAYNELTDGRRSPGNVGEGIIKSLNLLDSLDNIKTIHRLPNISLSRDKVKMWTDANNAKVIRDADAADVKIISLKAVEKVVSNWWRGSLVTKSTFMLSLNKFHNHTGLISDMGWDKFLIDMEDIDDESLILTGDNYRYNSGSSNSWFSQFLNWSDTLAQTKNEFSDVQLHVQLSDWKAYKSMLSGTFMLDSTANKLMSSDSVTFDDEMFINVKNMLKSGNKDDVTMAMTTIANCNIEDSKTYLAMLFFHYSENYFRPNGFYNSVSFKAVRSSFQKYADLTYQHGHTSPYGRLINYMLEDGSLNESAIQHVLDLVFERVIMGPTGMGLSDVFSIKRSSLTLKPEAREKLHLNVV